MINGQRAAYAAHLCTAVLMNGAAQATEHAAATETPTERGGSYTLQSGDLIEHAGVMRVTGGRFDRTETFEVVRHPDGGSTLTTVIRGATDSYRVAGSWTYSADDRALAASGEGNYAGAPVTVNILVEDNQAQVEYVDASGNKTMHSAQCDERCLLDMAPSALPMFAMTRRYDDERGGPQVFSWVARSLIIDQVLLQGTVEIRKLGTHSFARDEGEIDVNQYAFVETLKDESTGKFFKIAFNLYTDADHRPLGFGTGSSTRGELEGYAGLTTALPPEIPNLN